MALRPLASVTAGVETDVSKRTIPAELEKGEMPLNTYSNKAPFKGKIKSVERIVGPKATGETCHIIIETEGKIPFWEGQSYGVIPPVSICIKHLSAALVLGASLDRDYAKGARLWYGVLTRSNRAHSKPYGLYSKCA